MSAFSPLSPDAQAAAALPVLIAARQLVVHEGEEPLQAIAVASNSGISGEYARRILRGVLYEANLLAWQSNPATLKSDKRRAFDRAIVAARRLSRRRGGWNTSGGKS